MVDVATDTVAQAMDYDTFGRVISDTNPRFKPFGFAGGLHDRDTKLMRFGVYLAVRRALFLFCVLISPDGVYNFDRLVWAGGSLTLSGFLFHWLNLSLK